MKTMKQVLEDLPQTKICTKCKKPKTINSLEFRPQKTGKYGYMSICRVCESLSSKKYKKENPEKNKEFNKNWIENNKEHISLVKKEWNINNPLYASSNGKRFRNNNPNYNREYYNNRRRNDIEFRIKANLRSRVHDAIVNQSGTKALKTLELLGCTGIEAYIYLESKFQDNMSWNNYGRNGWEIDHIIPCDSFDLTNPEEQKKCFHYTNLQPLWKKDNRIKGNKII